MLKTITQTSSEAVLTLSNLNTLFELYCRFFRKKIITMIITNLAILLLLFSSSSSIFKLLTICLYVKFLNHYFVPIIKSELLVNRPSLLDKQTKMKEFNLIMKFFIDNLNASIEAIIRFEKFNEVLIFVVLFLTNFVFKIQLVLTCVFCFCLNNKQIMQFVLKEFDDLFDLLYKAETLEKKEKFTPKIKIDDIYSSKTSLGMVKLYCEENERWYLGLGWSKNLLKLDPAPWRWKCDKFTSSVQLFKNKPFCEITSSLLEEAIKLKREDEKYSAIYPLKYEFNLKWNLLVKDKSDKSDDNGWSYSTNLWIKVQKNNALAVTRSRTWYREVFVYSLADREEIKRFQF